MAGQAKVWTYKDTLAVLKRLIDRENRKNSKAKEEH